MSPPAVLELAVQDLAGLRVAAAVGAARVELCAALGPTGGLTPSIGLVAAAVDAAQASGAAGRLGRPLGVHVLVRPRAGGFVYDRDERAVLLRDVGAAVRAGASGVVVGVLTTRGTVDRAALEELVAAAAGREVTVHRAVDTLEDPLAAVDLLAEAGVTRVLSSGGAARSIDGVATLRAMVGRARGRLEVMAGGGVRARDVAGLLDAGVDAVHLSARAAVVDPGGVGAGEGEGCEVTDPAAALAVAEALAAAQIHG